MLKLPTAVETKITAEQYGKQLKAQGYREIGWGAYSQVFHKPRARHVIKVGHNANRDGYLQYVRRVGLNSTNPHFPRISSVKIYDTDPTDPQSEPYYVVRMEKLVECGFNNDAALCDELGVESLYDFAREEIHRLTPKTKALSQVKRTLLALYKTHESDIKSGNVMSRMEGTRPTMVFTDPICYAL